MPTALRKAVRFSQNLGEKGFLRGTEKACLLRSNRPGSVPPILPARQYGPEPEPRDFAFHFSDRPIAFNVGSNKDLAVVGDSLWFMASSFGISRFEIDHDSVRGEFWHTKRAEALAFDQRRNLLLVSGIDSLYVLREGKLLHRFSLAIFNSRIRFIRVDQRGRYWFGTQDNGVFLVDAQQILHLDAKSGLPSDNCKAFEVSASGKVFVGTDKGLVVIENHENTPFKPKFSYHNRETSLPNDHIIGIQECGDTLWLATPSGLSFWLQNEALHTVSPSNLVIESILVNGKEIEPQDEYRFSHLENSLEVRFFDPQFLSSSYQYRVIGQDNIWKDLSLPIVHLPYLAPGNAYHLQVRARNSAWQWSPPTSLKFDIRAPFYASVWFFMLLTIGILGPIAYLLAIRYKNRIRLLKERDAFQRKISSVRLSALKARMDPHFIFNSLNSIQFLVSEGEDRKTFDFIAQFSSLIRMIVDKSDQDFILLAEEFEFCRLYLEVEAQRLDEDFRFQLHMDPDLPISRLYMPTMIIQPFLENAIWHGLMPKTQDRSLKLSFQKDSDRLRIIVEDNGIGRAAARRLKANRRHSQKTQSTSIFEQRIALL
ncbi:MAG: histidine kinase, partial [Bacteroidota bacterium]